MALPEKEGRTCSRQYPWAHWTPAMWLVHPSSAGVSSWSQKTWRPPPDTLESPRSESQGSPRALRRVTPHFGCGLIPRLIPGLMTRKRRGTSSVRFSSPFLQVTPPSSLRVTRGSSSTPRTEIETNPTSALQTREDPSAHARPNRGTPRRITAWPLQRRPYGTTLAAYPSRRSVRAVTSVRGRTRTGRIWSIRTSPFET
jgi:hypothetical protein